MKVIVDADACPVKDVVIKECGKRGIKVILVSSLSHFSTKDVSTHVEEVYVDAGPDAADYKVVQLASAGDFSVTQDYGLAALLLAKNVRVFHHMGYEYDKGNIDHMLATRHMSSVIRKGGGRTKGPKAFTDDDRMTFRKIFSKALDETKK